MKLHFIHFVTVIRSKRKKKQSVELDNKTKYSRVTMILSAYHNINDKNARLKANDILKNDFFSLFSSCINIVLLLQK